MKLRDKRKKVLKEYIAKRHLKSTSQRNIIFNEFVKYPGQHVTVEELYKRIKRVSPKIGFATVYRTLKLFKDCGIASERNFGDGKSRYEPVKFEGEHHHHLICTGCGKVSEFENQQIEHYLEEFAKLSGFKTINHKVELYGYCPSCRGKNG